MSKDSELNIADVSSNYIDIIKLADKIINGDSEHYGMKHCLDHYYNGVFDEDLDELEKLKSKVGYKYKGGKECLK